ncbi:hypothetical protein OG612_45620 (plasmid) [Streptomyces sp. NBC_01527]|uniref:hypothetical protein n=1 Tax=Streptomyces sp. NBC_01527 TaxID=2903894 RepID=UPI002F911A43
MTSLPTTTGQPLAVQALDRAVMVATRRERNFAPEQLTVTLHATTGTIALEGRPYGPLLPAPEWPELHLSTYQFFTDAFQPADLEAFTEAFNLEVARPECDLVLAVHADVPDYDLDDAYAWRYDPRAKGFVSVPPADAGALFHEDTRVLAYPWDKAPFSSVSALCPAEAH